MTLQALGIQPAVAYRVDDWLSVGAFEDQGVRITTADRSAGVLRGTRDAKEEFQNQ